jgi:hypothetical protein
MAGRNPCIIAFINFSFGVGFFPPIVSKAEKTGRPLLCWFNILSNASHAPKAATLFLNLVVDLKILKQ